MFSNFVAPAAANLQFSELERNKRYLMNDVFTQFNLSAARSPRKQQTNPLWLWHFGWSITVSQHIAPMLQAEDSEHELC
jgi:hypothetical protein